MKNLYYYPNLIFFYRWHQFLIYSSAPPVYQSWLRHWSKSTRSCPPVYQSWSRHWSKSTR
ncbi:hypothetical protein LINPERHAP2_LOCUS43123, partial [Linum perenne]